MMPTGRQFYLECAKLKPNDKKYIIECFKNFVRVLNKPNLKENAK